MYIYFNISLLFFFYFIVKYFYYYRIYVAITALIVIKYDKTVVTNCENTQYK